MKNEFETFGKSLTYVSDALRRFTTDRVSVEEYIMELQKSQLQEIENNKNITPRAQNTTIATLIISVATMIYVAVYGLDPVDMENVELLNNIIYLLVPLLVTGGVGVTAYRSKKDPRLTDALDLAKSVLNQMELNSKASQDQESHKTGD